MGFLGIPQPTANWLQAKNSLVQALADVLVDLNQNAQELSATDLVEGPWRMSATSDLAVFAVWHSDYLSSTGEEAWGFIKFDGADGLAAEPGIAYEVLERALYVINQRLRGLTIDGSYYHRSYPNGTHSLLAGRGSAARHLSVGYSEHLVADGDASVHPAIVCVGPLEDYRRLKDSAQKAGDRLDGLVKAANELVSPTRSRRVYEGGEFGLFRAKVRGYLGLEGADNEFGQIEVNTVPQDISAQTGRGHGMTYRAWTAPDSPLTPVQRRILSSDAIERHPLRIVGPGGSGKTLLMELLALRRLDLARERGAPVSVLYIVHNQAMAATINQRLQVLEADSELSSADRTLLVTTLSDYARRQLGLELANVIDADAAGAKEFQLQEVEHALRGAMDESAEAVRDSALFSEATKNSELFSVLSHLVRSEISTAIKGHSLENDRPRYTRSERSLSRLHSILTIPEREVVYRAYELYHKAVFEDLQVLDTDDVAISLLGRLRTPIWQLKRRDEGFDFVFVDETQLFNENERRLLPLLTKGLTNHVPVVLALDEAQEFFGQRSSGMAALGVEDITNESLSAIHRSTTGIVRVAFFVIQRTTDLFGAEFPNFTGLAKSLIGDDYHLAAKPALQVASAESQGLGKTVLKKYREMRRAGLKGIGIVCHADQYWETLETTLKAENVPLHVLLRRGERLSGLEPHVVLTKPSFVGGQEFDGVIVVGLEQGVTPPKVVGNEALAVAVEQQSLRELYVSVTRAKYRLVFVLSPRSSPSATLLALEQAGLVSRV